LEVQDIKISLITVTHNAERTISRCIESFIAQKYKNIECIIIDGGSTDGTIQIIDRYKDHINIFISEPDDGVYDAMNKGIMLAHGDIIGTLNADDYFAADDILALVASAFSDQEGVDILYGDLDYVDLDETIIRKWRTKRYVKGIYNWGWMPPHPTFYCRRLLFDRFGFYSLEYGTAADYELMLRFMHFNNTGGLYINKVMIKMQCGGMSNKSPINRIKAWGFDIKAMRNNGISYPLLTLIIKPLRKIAQYL
jgi:glycosyltransferase involved in cell wall biosynthesis